MSAVMRQDPWVVMPRLQEEINRLFGNARENDSSSATLSGERSQPAAKQGEDAQGRRIERGYGQFHRRFVLPDTVDSERVNATGSHGVLTVTIPKQPKSMPRRIQIGS